MKHQKHAAISRPGYGTFSRNEWAIIGTPCGNIQRLANQLLEELSLNWQTAYVDADHQSADPSNAAAVPLPTLTYTDKITHHRFDQKGSFGPFQFRPVFNDVDVTIVNGNHFKAKHQIVVIDPKKEVSLSKKLDRLTDVQLILQTDSSTAPYPFLKEHIENIDQIPILSIEDYKGITRFLNQQLTDATPPLNGLVLAGGKSQRMGKDKGAIDYHGKPQREYMADLLAPFCENVYLSCRPDQVASIGSERPLVADTFLGLGPMGAILSAFRENPNSAWLVVACDLPMLDQATLQLLTKHRNLSKIATTFKSPVNEFPEPLVTIWEPRSYPVLLQFLAQGYSCPRKALINSPIELLEVPNADRLKNVNTPDELAAVLQNLT